MWAKLGQLLVTYLLKPLIEKGVVAFVAYVKRKIKLKKKKKEDDVKAENHENSTTENSTDTFSDMP
jgi:YesN/AraC family two-component response regulator